MKDFFKIAGYCIYHSIMHPLTPIENTVGNPVRIPKSSPYPWWVSILVLVLGIISWCLSSCFDITGMDEASRAMVYIPLTHMTEKTLSIRNSNKG